MYAAPTLACAQGGLHCLISCGDKVTRPTLKEESLKSSAGVDDAFRKHTLKQGLLYSVQNNYYYINQLSNFTSPRLHSQL